MNITSYKVYKKGVCVNCEVKNQNLIFLFLFLC